MKKFSFPKAFWIFLIASIIGAFYEETLFIINHFIQYGKFAWEPRRGVFWGPLSPIYGIGALMLYFLLVNKKDNVVQTFIKAALLGGITEYGIGFLQEMVLGTTSWNYNNKFLNINGRTTIPFMLFLGLLGIFFVKIIYPKFLNLIDLFPISIEQKITTFLVILVTIDLAISWTALIRQTLRHHKVPPLTTIDKIYDKHFNDDYIAQKFPNMVRSL